MMERYAKMEKKREKKDEWKKIVNVYVGVWENRLWQSFKVFFYVTNRFAAKFMNLRELLFDCEWKAPFETSVRLSMYRRYLLISISIYLLMYQLYLSVNLIFL